MGEGSLKIRVFALLAAAGLVLLRLPLTAQDRFGELAKVVTAELEQAKTPGAIVAVIEQDKIAYLHAFGVANVESGQPLTPDMTFPLVCAAASTPTLQTADPIPWSDARKLDWRDFRARVPSELEGARSMLEYTYSIGCRDEQLRVVVTALFLPDQSWVSHRILSSGLANRLGLRHEQTHFDLKELYARRVRKMFADLASLCPRSDKELFAMAERVFQQEAAAQQLFENETQAGSIEARQTSWEQRVAADLRALKTFAAPKTYDTRPLAHTRFF